MISINNLTTDILEATYRELIRKAQSVTDQFPAHKARVNAVAARGGLRLVGQSPTTWNFTIHSGTSDKVYNATLEFLNLEASIRKHVMNKMLWKKGATGVDRRKLAHEVFYDTDLRVVDNCPADNYWAFQYIRSLGRYDAKYGEPETRRPTRNNRKLKGAFCKHITLLFDQLPMYLGTFSKFLTSNYGKLITSAEQQTKQRDVGVKKAVKGLQAKKAEKEEEKSKEDVRTDRQDREPEDE